MDLSFSLQANSLTEFFSPYKLVCGICHEILSAKPYGCSNCIALFCFECISRQITAGSLIVAPPVLPKMMKCPMCRTESEIVPNGLIRFFMEKNKGICVDCHAEMPLNQMKEHTSNQCPEGQIICEICGKMFIRKEHNPFVCSHVRCQYCHIPILKTEYQTHLDTTCPEIEIKCCFCSNFLKRAHMETHHTNFCPFAPRRCRFCGTEHYLKEIIQHETYICSERLITCSKCGIYARVSEIQGGIHRCFPN